MDYETSCSEPPAKVAKTDLAIDVSHQETKAEPSSLESNIVQCIKYVLAADNSRHNCKTRSKNHQVAENLTLFDLNGIEFVAVNVSLNEIASWKSNKIPHLCFPVRDSAERRMALIRVSTMLASLYQLMPCAIGIEIDPEKCTKINSQYHQLAELRRGLWRLLLTEILFMPPHLRTFLEAELKIGANLPKSEEKCKLPSINTVLTPRCPNARVKFETKIVNPLYLIF